MNPTQLLLHVLQSIPAVDALKTPGDRYAFGRALRALIPDAIGVPPQAHPLRNQLIMLLDGIPELPDLPATPAGEPTRRGPGRPRKTDK